MCIPGQKNISGIDRNSLLLIAAVGLLMRVIPLFNSAEWTDLYVQQALPILNHLNIYSAAPGIFPYSPVSMFLPALCAKLSFIFNVPFHVVMRLPGIAADTLIALSIYAVLAKLGKKNAVLAGLLYALNPVSILISSFHGNVMPIAVLFSFLAYAVLLFGVEKNYRLSALLLGAAIGFRGYPVLLLPLFLIKIKAPWTRRLEYIAYSIIPTAVSFVPFLFLDHGSVIREVFSYSGFPDYGLAAILRAFYSYIYAARLYVLPGNALGILSDVTKVVFLAGYVMILLLAARKSLVSSIMAVFLAFYFIYTGISSQYLVWILPFAFIAHDRMLKYYLVIGTWALVNFYWVYHPYILFGKSGFTYYPLAGLLAGELISLGLLWLVCLSWAVALMAGKRSDTEGGAL